MIILTLKCDKDHRDHPKSNLNLRKVPAMAREKPANKLTLQILEKLKEKGYQYVVVESYTLDRRHDHIVMSHFLLKALKVLPNEPGELGIYESIDSPILREWADHPENGVEAYIG